MIGLPRSLRGRTVLLTVAGIIACELVTFGVLGVYRHTLLAGRAHDFLGSQIDMVRAALGHARPDEVAQELDRPPHQRNHALLGEHAPRLDAPGGLRPPPDRDFAGRPPLMDDPAPARPAR